MKKPIQVEKKPVGYWRKHGKALKGSLKSIPTKSFWKAAFFDACLIIGVYVLVIISGIIISRVSDPVIEKDLLAYNAIQSGDVASYEAILQANNANLATLKNTAWAVYVSVFILIMFAITVFYDLAWSIRKEKKFALKDLGPRYLANVLWSLKWIVLFLVILLAFPVKVAAALVIVLGFVILYADPAFRFMYSESEGAWKNTSNGFAVAFTRPYKYLPFLVLFFLFAGALLVALSIIQAIPQLTLLCFVVALLVLIGWARSYIILLE